MSLAAMSMIFWWRSISASSLSTSPIRASYCALISTVHASPVFFSTRFLASRAFAFLSSRNSLRVIVLHLATDQSSIRNPLDQIQAALYLSSIALVRLDHRLRLRIVLTHNSQGFRYGTVNAQIELVFHFCFRLEDRIAELLFLGSFRVQEGRCSHQFHDFRLIHARFPRKVRSQRGVKQVHLGRQV